MVAVFLLQLLVSVQAGINQPTAEDREKIAALGALQSDRVVNITLSNYEMMFNGSDWAVLFCQAKHMRCQLLNVPWIKIAEQLRGREVVFGKALIEQGEKLFRLMGIRDVPSLLYVSEGFIYNYTGLMEWRAIEEVIYNQTYLQYDRVPVKPPASKVFSRYIDQVFKMQPPLYWTAEILAILLLSALIGGKAPTKPKTKED